MKYAIIPVLEKIGRFMEDLHYKTTWEQEIEALRLIKELHEANTGEHNEQ